MSETVKRTPLEDLMVAMDVVDTLRHREKLVARELDAEGRRERLIEHLREIYAAQGIEVTDAVLEEGVQALEEDRFSYDPPEKSFSTFLARLYVKRGIWVKPFLGICFVCIVGWSIYHFTMVRPESVRQNQLPVNIENIFKEISSVSQDKDATQQAKALLTSAQTALENQRYDEAAAVHRQLEQLLSQLKSNYKIRVVSTPNKKSGVWRVPDINSDARNYYLIVQALDDSGKVLTIPVTSEENGKTSNVTSWGLRVDERIFNLVAADKRDDGIIQKNIVGIKERGKLKPSYTIATPGSAITEW
ncbi:MAG: DUF6384 family protein [Desulforhopalus sp.]